ncbi:MAG: FitA-like ribbon-helix-helix domain-containing protein [Gaiellaceae bacterium]
MATLHARNIPYELYERLRAAAAEDGRSIGAEAAALLSRALSERDQFRRGISQMKPRIPTFREQFVMRAEQLVLRAQDHCRAVGSPEVTPAHVMLAMLEDPVLAPALERKGITEESVRAVLPPGPPRKGPAPISDEARQMLENALVQSLGL